MNSAPRVTSALFFFALLVLLPTQCGSARAEIVSFPSGTLTLQGMLYKPRGDGPFPAVVYNHGSAPGMLSEPAFQALGPVFVSHGWVFFGPNRRGQAGGGDASENRWHC